MRSLNYTGRQRIRQEDVTLVLYQEPSGVRQFEASIDLAAILKGGPMPPDALITVEAFNGHGLKFSRFDHGTISSPTQSVRRSLEQFGANELIDFRVKVVDKAGTILAMADNVRPLTPEEGKQRSLLPVSVEPLDGVVFRVSFPEEGRPTLILNESLDDSSEQGIKAFARSSWFLALVYPNVVREILTRILVVEQWNEDGDGAPEWASKWLRYAKSLNSEPLPEFSSDDQEPRMMWIDDVVSAAGRQLNAVPNFREVVGTL